MKKGTICNKGSVEDVRCALIHAFNITPGEIAGELIYETENKNRSSVKNMLVARHKKAIRNLEKAQEAERNAPL